MESDLTIFKKGKRKCPICNNNIKDLIQLVDHYDCFIEREV